ncbi:MAG: hypothetical protein IKQ94_11270 [Bacteroidales bacterium]|nr:hypothetical protein [Bacteroidales bacterium]
MKKIILKKVLPLVAVALIGVAIVTSCEKRMEEKNVETITIEGVINTLLTDCHDDAIVIDVNNIDNIGLDGLYVCHGDTLAVMNNSIEVDDTKLINKYTPNATISIVCRKATVDDAYMFRHDQNIACTGDHIPSGMPKYIVNKVLIIN